VGRHRSRRLLSHWFEDVCVLANGSLNRRPRAARRSPPTERSFNIDGSYTLVMVDKSASGQSTDKGRKVLTACDRKWIMEA
jgi:hypothetical protein